MAKSDKDGFFKRLFGGKTSGRCCSVKIEKIEEEPKDDTGKETSQEGCCKQTIES